VVDLDLYCDGATTPLAKGDRVGMFEIDGFVRGDNSDDTACGTCVGADPNLNRVCRGDAQEGGSDNYIFRAEKSICQSEYKGLIVQQSCQVSTQCTVCGDPAVNAAGGKTRINQLVFRWVPVGGNDRNDITTAGVFAATPTTSVAFSNLDLTTGMFVLITVDGSPFETNTDFTVGNTTVTLHT